MGKKLAFCPARFFLYSIFSINLFLSGTRGKTEISEGVFPALEKQEFIPVIVVLKDRANLSDALLVKRKKARLSKQS